MLLPSWPDKLKQRGVRLPLHLYPSTIPEVMLLPLVHNRKEELGFAHEEGWGPGGNFVLELICLEDNICAATDPVVMGMESALHLDLGVWPCPSVPFGPSGSCTIASEKS